MSLQIQDFISSIGTPARTYIWDVAIPRIPESSFRAQTAQFPSVGSTDIDLFYQGHTVKFAGGPEYEHVWTAAFVEAEDGNMYDRLYSWRQLVHNQRLGTQSDPDVYKDDIQITALKSSDNSPWLKAVLYGAYPKTIEAIELDRSANTEVWRWNVSFSYDWWEKV